ncbi:MAG: hypothetical protein V1855_02930, partial [bacterium]
MKIFKSLFRLSTILAALISCYSSSVLTMTSGRFSEEIVNLCEAFDGLSLQDEFVENKQEEVHKIYNLDFYVIDQTYERVIKFLFEEIPQSEDLAKLLKTTSPLKWYFEKQVPELYYWANLIYSMVHCIKYSGQENTSLRIRKMRKKNESIQIIPAIHFPFIFVKKLLGSIVKNKKVFVPKINIFRKSGQDIDFDGEYDEFDKIDRIASGNIHYFIYFLKKLY